VPEQFLLLPKEEREAILESVAREIGVSVKVLEKDVWVCWCLETLFSMPNRLSMVFKGGTSLSKVFGVIFRFSEDIDITIDFREMERGVTGPDKSQSKAKNKNLAELMGEDVKEYVVSVLAPYFEEQVKRQFPDQEIDVQIADNGEVSERGEEIHVSYVSAIDTANSYLKEVVKLEFGGRNSVDPQQSSTVVPDLAIHVQDLVFPSATVDVLAAERTFWEKATLAHSECNRGEKLTAERKSRHWYDLYELSKSSIGQSALNDIDLLADVVLYKKTFYHAGYAKYDECLIGKLNLIPNTVGVTALESDYQQMIDQGMFFRQPPTFEEIMEHLATMQNGINARVLAWNEEQGV
jgi:hypothetical protein